MDIEQKITKETVDAFAQKIADLKKEIATTIVGQERSVEEVLISIFSQGHAVLIGVPGLAKTLLVNTVSQVLGLDFNRIQFTPDLMPSDITGSEIMNEKKELIFRKGPLFANIILADEINRTPPKTQSALLEAMQEHTITVAGRGYHLASPFFVLATQNPIEQEGTYPLPEAQLDRFMFSIYMDYPTFEQEVEVVKTTTTNVSKTPKTVIEKEDILLFQQLVRAIPVNVNVMEYAVTLASRTRPHTSMATDFTNKYLSWGAGPRASQYLILGAKCIAAMKGKYAPDIEDIKQIAAPVLQHRIVRNFKAESEHITEQDIIQRLINLN